MFSTSYHSASAYKQVGVETDVLSADPHQLIMLLFDGALAAIAMAKKAMDENDIAQKGNLISRAIDIIDNGLRASLDFEKGQDLAERLSALYTYMAERLLYANLKNEQSALDEVALLLSEIKSAWAEIRSQVIDNAPPAA